MILLAFASVVFMQILAPALTSKPIYRALAVHLRNGLYANAVFDQIIGSLRIYGSKNSSVEIEKMKMIKRLRPIEVKSYEEQTT